MMGFQIAKNLAGDGDWTKELKKELKQRVN